MVNLARWHLEHDRATIYLLHVVDATGKTARLQHAGHYIGSTDPGVATFERRMREHRNGKGARITAAFLKAGLTWVVARTWHATRGYEFTLKKMGGAARICPICQEEKLATRRKANAVQRGSGHFFSTVLGTFWGSEVRFSPVRPTNPYLEIVSNVMVWGGTNGMAARGESR